jgi:DNA modification methylase
MGIIEATIISTVNMEILHEGDCLEIMQTLQSESVDMIFADPPFNVGKKYGGKSNTDNRSYHYGMIIGTGTHRPCRLCFVKYAVKPDIRKDIVRVLRSTVFRFGTVFSQA